jgi:N-acetylmuramoyl-L-alanine amidase
MGVMFEANYSNLRVNTDNYCLDGFEWETVYNPSLLADVDAIKETMDVVADVVNIIGDKMSKLIDDLYENIKLNKDINNSVNNFVNDMTEELNNIDLSQLPEFKDLSPEEMEQAKQELIETLNSDEFKEQFAEKLKEAKQKIETEGLSKEEFAQSLKQNLKELELTTDSLFYKYNYNPYNFLLMFDKKDTQEENNLQINTAKKVAIDPGHGDQHSGNKQIDPGAVSDKDYEKDLALKIALEIRNRLLERNVNTLMTREDDIVVEGKRIKWRLEKAHKDSCDIFVSIHLNSSTNKQANGFVVLYLENDEMSKELAEEIVKTQTVMDIRGNGLEKRPNTGPTRVGVLCDFKGEASVLVEVGFISNQEDLELMKTKYKDIGVEIADGICEYLKKEK